MNANDGSIKDPLILHSLCSKPTIHDLESDEWMKKYTHTHTLKEWGVSNEHGFLIFVPLNKIGH